ncbi:putative ribonuclease H-like domain-containing protein [Tanacetum coccineum]
MNQFCGIKGIKREFSNVRTPQQNRVAERKNRTLIEAARTMVLVTKPHNKTPYELLIGRTPIISFMRPFGCPVTILNTLDHLGKFDGKADEGFLVGYSINNKSFRVFNSRTKKVEENLHVNFLENKPNVTRNGPEWLFDIDYLTNSMNYHPVSAGNRTNGYAGSEVNSNAGQAKKEKVSDQEYIFLPLMHTSLKVPSSSEEAEPNNDAGKKATEEPACDEGGKTDNHGRLDQKLKSGADHENINNDYQVPNQENYGIFDDAYDDRDEGAEADYNNLETIIPVSLIPSTRAHKDHPKDQPIGEMEPKKVTQALDDESWVEVMHEEILQNKKDQRGIVVRNKARLVAQGHRQEEGIDCDEVFALLQGLKQSEEEVYVSQPPSFVDPEFPNKVYKVEKALYGLHQAPRAWYETLSIYLLENGFRRGTIDKTLFIKNDILLVQVSLVSIVLRQQALQRKTHKHRRTKKDIELPQTSVPQNLRPDEAIHKEEVTVWKGLSLLVLAQMQHITVITYLRPRPRQCLMLKFLREQIQVAVPGAKKPWGVLDLENAKDAQAVEILTLKKRVKKLERHRKSSISHPRRRKYKQVESFDDDLDEEDASKQGRTKDKTQPMFKDKDFDELEDVEVNVDEQITTTRPSQVNTARPEVSTSTPSIPPTTTTVFDDEDVTMAMAQTLMKMRSEKAKETEKGVAIREKEESPKLTRSTTTLQPLPTIDPKDKGKGVLVEEPEKPVKIKRRDQDQFTIEERAKFLVETIEAHKKFRATQRAAKIRSKPPTKSQLRNMMMTYLKNMGDYKHSQLKGKTYEEIHELYERQQKRIQDFIPMDPEKEVIKDSGKKDDSSSKLAGGTRRKTLARKRAGEKQSKESAKRQKLEDTAEEQESAEITEEAATNYEQENEELRMWLTIIPDEEETVDLEILSAKYPIIDWESQSLGSDIHVYKIIRADGFTSYHKIFSSMLRKLDRQDLIDLHRLVMKRFEDTTPEGYNLLLWEI